MTFLRLPSPIPFPSAALAYTPKVNYPLALGALNADAAGEIVGIYGHVRWADGSASKAMGSSSKIHFRLASTFVMADASTSVRVGIQGIKGSAGGVSYPQPDGTYTIYRDFAGNAGVLSTSDANTFASVTLSTSGSPTINNGQLIAAVAELIARAGADVFSISVLGADGQSGFPGSAQFTTTWISGANANVPVGLIEANDGTLGIIEGGWYFIPAEVSFNAAATPDEYALAFTVPFLCKTSAAYVNFAANGTGVDWSALLIEDPLGSATQLASATYYGDWGNSSSSSERVTRIPLDAEVTLKPGITYALSVRSDNSSAVSLGRLQLANANHRTIQGLENCRQITRNNGGAFGSEDTTLIPSVAVELSHIAIASGTSQLLIGMN